MLEALQLEGVQVFLQEAIPPQTQGLPQGMVALPGDLDEGPNCREGLHCTVKHGVCAVGGGAPPPGTASQGLEGRGPVTHKWGFAARR